jgi:uncharacterized membrane protein YbhN (UPF0104 family)
MSGHRVPTRAGMELLFAAMLGRYTPAKLGMPVVGIAIAGGLGLSGALVTASMVLMVLVYTVLGLGIGIAAVMFAGGSSAPVLGELSSAWGWLALVGMTVAIVLLVTVDRNRAPEILRRKLRLDGSGPLVNLGHVGWFVVVYLLWLAHGVLLVLAVGGDVDSAWASSGWFVLAPVVGFLAVVAPGGLGVREAVIAGVLTPAIGSAPAVAAAILSRIVSMGVDFAMWLAFRTVRAQPSP